MSIVTFFTIYYHYDYPFVIYYLNVYESMIIYDPLPIIIYYYLLLYIIYLITIYYLWVYDYLWSIIYDYLLLLHNRITKTPLDLKKQN